MVDGPKAFVWKSVVQQHAFVQEPTQTLRAVLKTGQMKVGIWAPRDDGFPHPDKILIIDRFWRIRWKGNGAIPILILSLWKKPWFLSHIISLKWFHAKWAKSTKDEHTYHPFVHHLMMSIEKKRPRPGAAMIEKKNKKREELYPGGVAAHQAWISIGRISSHYQWLWSGWSSVDTS